MRKTILFVIILLALALRFYKLDVYPALNADEAAIGYNAYSLLETGKDEHGNSWPIHFQSFNDYKPGLYFYLVLPFVKLLGLSVWAVRIPGALFGVMSVFVIYLLAKKISDKNYFPEFASLLLAISPWHIHFSRGGWETNVATFFLLSGVFCFLVALEKKKYFMLSAICFVASLYVYHSARIIAPLLIVFLSLFNFGQVMKGTKWVVLSFVFASFLLVPLLVDFSKGASFSRAAGVGLFADTGPLSRVNEQRGEHGDFGGAVAKLFHNKPVNYTLSFLQNWSEHYWGEFLFLSGDDIQRNKVPETGQMHLVEAVFLAVGMVLVLRRSKGWETILFWLLVAPVAAAFTFQSPHALRAHNMIIPLTLVSAFGLSNIVFYLKYTPKNKYLKKATWLGIEFLFVMNFFRYTHMYFGHMAKEYPFSSQYGVKELVEYVSPSLSKYEKIIVSDRYDQPYILFLFYLKYPPSLFQREHELTPRDRFGFSTVRAFDRFEFKGIDFDSVKPQNPNSLIIGTDEEIPKEANIVKKIYGTNNYLYFKVVEN